MLGESGSVYVRRVFIDKPSVGDRPPVFSQETAEALLEAGDDQPLLFRGARLTLGPILSRSASLVSKV